MFNELRDRLKEKFDYWGQGISDADVMDFSEYDLHEAIHNCPSFKLFRYMPPKYYSIRNFEKQIIHLSENGVMNDIYEGIPCLQEEPPHFIIQKLHDIASMICFTETNNNPLMWSHYAQNHEGFCIEYDLKLLHTDPLYICRHLFPVIYGKTRPISRNLHSLIESHCALKKAIDDNYVYDGVEMLDDILPLFLTKGMDWNYEQEWRIVYTKKQIYDIDDKALYSGNLHFPCITAVYLGYRIDPDIKANLIEVAARLSHAEKRQIHIYQATLEHAGYGILFDQINMPTKEGTA